MKLKTHPYYLVALFMLLNSLLFAQEFIAGDQITLEVYDYCLIETNHAPVSLNLNSAASIPGTPVSSVSNSDTYLKISSIVFWIFRRKVSVRISSGTVPEGTILTVVAAPSITGDGDLGDVIVTPRVLSSTDRTIISGIGSCYTGTDYTDGYQLTYTWSTTSNETDYGLIHATESPVTVYVVYTISAQGFY